MLFNSFMRTHMRMLYLLCINYNLLIYILTLRFFDKKKVLNYLKI